MEIITIKEDSSPNIIISEKSSKGRTGLVWRGNWSGNYNYYVGDGVQYLGSSYICKRYVDANSSGFPSVLTEHWDILSSIGDIGKTRISISTAEPIGFCSTDIYTTESSCVAGQGTWSALELGDIWVNSSTNVVYIRVVDLSSSAQIWSAIAKGQTSDDIAVSAHNNMPSGTLQNALEHLEDQLYQQNSAPSGGNLSEGDLWYDTNTDRMNVYRNNTWEVLTTSSALSTDAGYDNISMNGGYF